MKIRKLNISSINGFRIGNATDKTRGTGCTVIICEKGAVGGVDVRGGGPATIETDLLRSENTVSEVNAVVLSGGSSFGLEATSGVKRALADKGVGFRQWDMNIPIVCGASLFDLGAGDSKAFPDVRMGVQAVRNAYGGVFKTGNEGAGTGASVGKFHGMERAMKTGLGAFACGDDFIQVGAVVAVNAMGDVYSGAGNIIAGLRTKDGGSIYGTIRALKGMVHEYSDSSDHSAAGMMSFAPPKEEKLSEKDRKAMLAQAMEQEFRRTTQFRKEEVEKLFAEMEKEEKKKKEAEKKKKQEAAKKKLDAEKKKKAEAEKKRKAAEAKKREEERRIAEAEKKRFEEEQARIAEERKQREEEERRKIEEEQKRLEAEAQKKIEEERKKKEKETEDFYLSMLDDLNTYNAAEETADAVISADPAELTDEAALSPEDEYLELAVADDEITDEAAGEEAAEEDAEDASEEINEETADAAEQDHDKPEETAAEDEKAEAAPAEETVESVAVEEAAETAETADEEASDDEEDTAAGKVIEELGNGRDEPVLDPVKEKLETAEPVKNDAPVVEVEDPVKVHDAHAAENTAVELEKLFADADVSIDEPPTEAAESEYVDDDKMGYDIPFNTTIGCLITNAKLTKSQANKLAAILHDAYARAIKPVHSTLDGDTIFVLSTCQQEVNFDAFAALATDVMQYAIIDGANSAKGAYGLPAAKDMK